MSIPFTSNLWQGRLLTSPDDVKASASSLTLTAGSNTDWWRATHGSVPESDVDRHSGPLYVVEVADDQQTWTAGVWMAVEHGERFQQATLFVGQGDFVTARDPWLKAGVEIEEKRQNIGCVCVDRLQATAMLTNGYLRHLAAPSSQPPSPIGLSFRLRDR